MMVAQDLIFTYLHTYLDLSLTVSFVGIQISLGTSYFFDRFLSFRRSSWLSCSSQAFWFWFSFFRQSHSWHSMQMPCNVSFMYDHAWMKCLCIKSIFSFFLLSDLPHFLSACTSQVDFSDLLYFFHLLSQVNISTLMLSRHVIFLSSKTNIIWFSHCRKYRIPFLLFHHFSMLDFSLNFRVVNKFRIHNEQSLMECN